MPQPDPQTDHREFRAICGAAGIAVTHQRQILFEVLQETSGHPSPEEIYLRVKQRIPSVSLATVYKNIHLFLQSGIFHEVSPHHGSLRVETNLRPHHHLVCVVCKNIRDVDEEDVGFVGATGKLPGDFLVERLSVDILGRCSACRQKAHA